MLKDSITVYIYAFQAPLCTIAINDENQYFRQISFENNIKITYYMYTGNHIGPGIF